MKDKKVLDIGSGPGFLLSLLSHKGAKVFGIEPSERYCQQAKKMYGLNLINSELEDINLKKYENKFDLVCLSHVLEHVYSPVFFLKAIKKILKENGRLYIEVPSLESFSKYDINSELLGFTHIWHFWDQTLINAVESLGFELRSLGHFKRYGVIRAIFIKIPKRKNIAVNFSNSSKKMFLTYIKKREQKTNLALRKIRFFEKENRPVIFFGASGHLYELIKKNPSLFRGKHFYIVDSNPHKQNVEFGGLFIKNPSSLSQLKSPVIFISSRLFTIQDSIRKSVRELNFRNPTIVDLFKIN